MKNMFKKSLVAIALVGMSSSAMAAEIDSTAQDVAKEWLDVVAKGTAASPTTLATGSISLTLGAAYTQNDLINLTFTGDSLRVASLPGTISLEVAASPLVDNATLGLISTGSDANGNTVATYRVTVANGNTTNAAGAINSVNLEVAKIVNSVNVSFAAETATGQALDTGGVKRTANLITVGSQFASLAGGTGLNATIDVSADRKKFVSSQTISQAFTISPQNMGTAAAPDPFSATGGYEVDGTKVDYTLTGNFGWMFTTAASPAFIPARFTVAGAGCALGTGAAAPTASAIVVSCDSMQVPTIGFDLSANTAVVPTQTINIAAKVAYEIAGGSAAEKGTFDASTAAGTWTLNGSEVNVAYMPYSGSISQVINVTNRSSQSGDISVVAIDEAGNSHDLGVVGHSAAGSITRIAGDIQSALSQAAGVNLATVGQTQRFALQIVTNAPESDVEVYSAYNVAGTGARLVVNDSNGGALSK